MSQSKSEDPQIAITLPSRYWTIILSLVNEFMRSHIGPEIEQLRRQGVNPETIGEPKSTILAGPVLIQGAIVKALAEHGVMTKEANETFGLDALMAKIKQPPDSPTG